MATKLICDRCGAEINPMSSVTYAGVRRFMEVSDNNYELCVSCTHKLRVWLSGKESEDD
nr:MAG TPA: zinc finger protein [Caudoviricetes sp.]